MTINPPSKGKRFILVNTDYVRKWTKEKAVPRETEYAVVSILFEYIFARFGVPQEIVIDQGAQFTSKLVQYITKKYKVKCRTSTPYHPQPNGHVESKNKVLEGIITKTIQFNKKKWADRFLEALWTYRTTWKNTTGYTPCKLVYGKQILFLI